MNLYITALIMTQRKLNKTLQDILKICFRCLDFTKLGLLLLGLFFTQRKIIKIVEAHPILNVHKTFT